MKTILIVHVNIVFCFIPMEFKMSVFNVCAFM